MSELDNPENCVAIVGMAGEFPGADSVEQFWRNLVAGTCTISPLSLDKVNPDPLRNIDPDAPNFVPVSAGLRGAAEFDADFFGFSAREAEITDPQHRRFLTCAWRALEDAAIDCERFEGLIGVAAGSSLSRYIMNCLSHKEIVATTGFEAIGIGNNIDFLPTQLSYKLNLQGPSYAIQTACSTSLVAVHSACQMLLNHECDLALAGAACISAPQNSGYLYQEGGILSPDGVCRTFDEEANGTVFGSGVGVVVLQRLDEAIAQNSRIHAVIRGSAINNDGRQKIGFTAPGMEGQSRVIVESLAVSGVEAESISLVEAHGTGTRMGDPVEVAALTQAFRSRSSAKQFCALSSVKPNVGHLDAAAGMAGLIKTIMSLKYHILPPSINVKNINRDLDIENSPFYINNRLAPWKTEDRPRRAGVSAMGIGGTNAHIIVEEWCDDRPRRQYDDEHVVVMPLSAKDEKGLATLRMELAGFMASHPDIRAADAAYTFAVGRRSFSCRQTVMLPVGLHGAALGQKISAGEMSVTLTETAPSLRVVLSHWPAIQAAQCRQLWQEQPLFAHTLNETAALFGLVTPQGCIPLLDCRPDGLRDAQAEAVLSFSLQLGLYRLWKEWGIQPDTLCASGIGELLAAYIAQFISLPAALALVCRRFGPEQIELPPALMAAEPVNTLPATVTIYFSDRDEWLQAGSVADDRWMQRLASGGMPSDTGEMDPPSDAVTLAVGQPTADGAAQSLLETAGELWRQGVAIDWLACYQQWDCRRVGLPGYPLAKKSYWLDYQAPVEQETVATTRQTDPVMWFWQHSWHRRLVMNRQTTPSAEPWLMFIRAGEPSEQLADELEKCGQTLIRVYAGEKFERHSAISYVVVPESVESYRHLIDQLDIPENVSTLIHCWTMNSAVVAPETSMAQGFYSGLSLLQALAAETAGRLQVWWITDSVFQVVGNETLYPYQALINGLNRVVTQESGRLISRQLDLHLAEHADITHQARAIISEVLQQPDETVIALRHGQRWVFAAERLTPGEETPTNHASDGVYLITGGLGQFGLAAARYFVRRYPQARVILTSRAGGDIYQETYASRDDIAEARFTALEALRGEGAQIDIEQVDAGDAGQLDALLTRVCARYGKITGIVHAAGLIGEQTHLSFIKSDRQHCERMFRAKVSGTQALIDVLADKPIDFVMLVSSLSPLLGGLGLTAYAAANSFMDSCAAALNGRSSTHWISVNWEGWIRQGGAAHYDELGKKFQRLSLNNEEIGWCMEKILADSTLSNVIVSTASLSSRMQRWSTHSGMEDTTGTTTDDVSVSYATGDAGAIILEMARQLLGDPQLTPDDDLFKKGADSLSCIQLIARIRDVFNVDLPMQTLFDKPTVASLARSIATSDEDEALLSLVERLEAMDEEEANTLSQQVKDGQSARWIEI
ncbi:SDR family NAD(P)-dependent oxidoreductase [Pectobacteriaceae bacterium CE90]|nr:SDR family NAD(P)-dependent oxidoreductase [Pectobacteriaceae bacterium CE90]